MKIIYISGASIPSKLAKTVHVIKMCEAFQKQGVTTVLYGKGCPQKTKDVYIEYGVDFAFDIKLFNCSYCGPLKPLINAIKTVYSLYKEKKQGLLVIYTRSPLLLPVCVFFSKNVFYESHGIGDSFVKNAIEQIFLRLKRVQKVFVISEQLKLMYLNKYGFLNKLKLMVVHDAAKPLPNNTIKQKDTVGKNKHLAIVGYVGQLYKGRGIDQILRIANNMPNVLFHIVGGDDKTIKHYKDRVLSDNIVFKGWIKHSSLHLIYDDIDILIAPYQKNVYVAGNKRDTSNYMSPLKIFEYMSTGKPIICSNHIVLKEVLTNNENAIMLEPEDVDSWVSAINELINNPARGKELGQNAKNTFYQYFTWDARAKTILQTIEGSV